MVVGTLKHSVPDTRGITAVAFSSESENISIEVSAVCAFIAGGADLGRNSAAHTKACQVI